MYTFKQLSASKTSNCKLYPVYKEMLDKTSFLPEQTPLKVKYWYYSNDITKPVTCQCGCNMILKTPWKTKYVQGHSNSSQEVKEKKKTNLQQKYGDSITNVSQLENVKKKKEQTLFKNYGVTCPLDRKIVQPIWQKKYGVDNPSRLTEVRKKLSDTHKTIQPLLQDKKLKTFKENHYKKIQNHPLYKPLFTLEEYKGNGIEHKFECRKCGNIIIDRLTDGITFRCYTCNPKVETGGQSLIENEIEIFCKSLKVSLETQNRKIIPPLEIDIYIPEQKIGIELNGLYYHSEEAGKKRFYHRKKTELCEKANIRLIQIFEDEWVQKKKICKNRLKNILGKTPYNLYGRKCIVKDVDAGLKDKFLRKYHIQGADKSVIHKGLFYKNRLVAIMTFGQLRNALGYKDKQQGWELVRFCTLGSFNIVGGADKLLKHFIRDHKPKTIITYADLRWSQGNLYKKLGFKHLGNTVPNYWYVINNNRKHRFGYQKHLLPSKLKIFNPDLTEYENMQLNGYTRIWDCGHAKYVLEP